MRKIGTFARADNSRVGRHDLAHAIILDDETLVARQDVRKPCID